MRGLAVILALGAAPVAAQVTDCAEAVSQIDLNECTYAEWQAADAELNEAYQAAVTSAREYDGGSEGRAEETLRAAQRAWVAFRDAACEAEAATWEGGSAQPMIRNGCLGRLTAQRTEDLWEYAGN